MKLFRLSIVVGLFALPIAVGKGQSNDLLGEGRGLDHVGIAVRDLQESSGYYHESLGFNVSPGGKHPEGTQNALIHFEDETALELITVYDRQKAGWLTGFLEKHEGPTFVALDVSSAQATVSVLRQNGIPAIGPRGGTILVDGLTAPLPDMWWMVEFQNQLKPRDYVGGLGPIFFIQYDSKQADQWHRDNLQSGSLRHRNTAIGIRSVWLAVNNVAAPARLLTSAGLSVTRPATADATLGGKATELAARRGVVRLLEPIASSAGSKVASFLAERGESVMGVSIEVHNLRTAKDLIERATRRTLRQYPGPYGASILLSPDLTRGAWLELFQK
jgi:catechol 2,3-dioxygenase-like lactoylglutathione lyase family enzyme